MPWYASKRQTVSRNGKNVWVEKDGHVPEADTWEDMWTRTEEFVYWKDDDPGSKVENIRPVEEPVVVAKPEPALDDSKPRPKPKTRKAPRKRKTKAK